jgi:hypothetical protein
MRACRTRIVRGRNQRAMQGNVKLMLATVLNRDRPCVGSLSPGVTNKVKHENETVPSRHSSERL